MSGRKRYVANGDVQWVDIMEQVSYGYSLNVGVDPIINGEAGKCEALGDASRTRHSRHNG